jgi:hypothetical protein
VREGAGKDTLSNQKYIKTNVRQCGISTFSRRGLSIKGGEGKGGIGIEREGSYETVGNGREKTHLSNQKCAKTHARQCGI